DHRVVAAPAVRVAVVKFAFGDQCSARLQQFDNGRIGLKYGLALIFRQTFGEATLIVEWRVSFEAILLAHGKVFGAMPRSRMHKAAALFQRDMLAEDSGNDAIEEGMLEFGLSEDTARKWAGTGPEAHPCLLLDAANHLFSNDVGITPVIRSQYIFKLRIESQRHASGQRPWGSGPDQSVK